MKDILYGKIETKEVLDDDGSTIMTVNNIVKGVVNKPIRRNYEIKKRVTSEKEELEHYLQFSKDIASDRTMLDPAFKVERSKIGDVNGYYYVARCYTRFEY